MRETMSSKGHFRYQEFRVTCAESATYRKSERFRGGVGMLGAKLNFFGAMRQGESGIADPPPLKRFGTTTKNRAVTVRVNSCPDAKKGTKAESLCHGSD
jgi:hypothetical protein